MRIIVSFCCCSIGSVAEMSAMIRIREDRKKHACKVLLPGLFDAIQYWLHLSVQMLMIHIHNYFTTQLLTICIMKFVYLYCHLSCARSELHIGWGMHLLQIIHHIRYICTDSSFVHAGISLHI